MSPKRKAHGDLNVTAPINPAASPSRSLQHRLTHLEERHALLKMEYDNLRGKYMQDLKHWKEYKAAETTRINLKRQRRAERKQARGKSISTDRTTDDPHEALEKLPAVDELVAASDHSQSMTRENARSPVSMEKQSDEVGSPMAEAVVDNKGTPGRLPEGPVTRSQTRLSQQSPEASPRGPHRTTKSPGAFSVDKQLEPGMSTPTGQVSKQLRTLGRVTPWLGSGVPGPSSSKSKGAGGVKGDEDEDIFGDRQDPPYVSGMAVARTPLVRDRGLAATSSLRRSLLHRGAAESAAENAVSTTPSTASRGAKRKLVDLELLSPAEKAAELKQLSKMTSKEKREFYAEYKGKGRYVPPKEVYVLVRASRSDNAGEPECMTITRSTRKGTRGKITSSTMSRGKRPNADSCTAETVNAAKR